MHELQAERDIAAGWVSEGRRPDNSAQIKAANDANDKIDEYNSNLKDGPAEEDPVASRSPAT